MHWLASGCQFYDVSQMFVSNATSGTGGRSRGRNPVDFLIKGKQFLNDLPRLVDSPVFFSSSLEMPKMDHFYDHFGLL